MLTNAQAETPERINYVVHRKPQPDFATARQNGEDLPDLQPDLESSARLPPFSTKTVQDTDNEDEEVLFPEKISPDFDVEDTIALYLKEISRIPLLTQAEEVQLAKAIERGKKAAQRLKQSPHLAADEQLNQQIKEGQEARCKLIEANFRLVVSIATRYVGHGVSFMDLIQEGDIGLI
ncbi:MAG: hypothetical protein D6768_09975, partial [Chloroflexi bacterium]